MSTAAGLGLLALVIGGIVLVNVLISTPIELVGRLFSEGTRGGGQRQRFSARAEPRVAATAVVDRLEQRFGRPASASAGKATFVLADQTRIEVTVAPGSNGSTRAEVRLQGGSPAAGDEWAEVRGLVLAALRSVDPNARVVR